MKRYIKTIVICSITLVAVSCGKQHKAESTVKDFLNQNMTATDYSISFNKIDSTKNLTDSMIIVMKNNAKKNSLFKKDIEYGTGNKPYIFTKTKIYDGKDTVPYTFYLDNTLKNVVSFKMH